MYLLDARWYRCATGTSGGGPAAVRLPGEVDRTILLLEAGVLSDGVLASMPGDALGCTPARAASTKWPLRSPGSVADRGRARG